MTTAEFLTCYLTSAVNLYTVISFH